MTRYTDVIAKANRTGMVTMLRSIDRGISAKHEDDNTELAVGIIVYIHVIN